MPAARDRAFAAVDQRLLGQDFSFLSSLAAVLATRWRTEPAPLAAVPA
jgi:hypothetical protein